jgi:SulP family sulfate permease
MYVPKTYTVLKEGYSASALRDDLIAALTVAIVAIPLSMALAIASGASPGDGLITVVVAGFLISLLSGSRHQIGGPAGAFVVIVFSIIQAHGYDGLILATLMAGVIMIVAGLAGVGNWIRYIPQPVVIGFTVGIALIILSSQIGDLLGLTIKSSGNFIEQWVAYWDARDTITPVSVLLSAGSLLTISLLRIFVPKAPGLLIAVVAASVAAWHLISLLRRSDRSSEGSPAYCLVLTGQTSVWRGSGSYSRARSSSRFFRVWNPSYAL